MPLEPDQQLHLTVAQGFVELRMFLDADAAMDDIDPFCMRLPEVLAVRLQIYEALKRWEPMQVVAKMLVEYEPENVEWWISWACATRGAESVEAARLILVNAVKQDLNDAAIHYDLARYECKLGNLEGAKDRLKRCFGLDPDCRLKALGDQDLEALWLSL
jgi:tetratricopeptide (TPR) repeat protein